jgi:hypothetical protein
MTTSNIRSSFTATGLIPLDPEQVLYTISRPLTPPEPSPATYNPLAPETPHNVHQLERQVTVLKSFLQRRSKSPPSPTDTALKKLVKGCEMAMHSVVLLTAENERLRIANERQKRKRQLKRRFISKESALSAAEAASMILGPEVVEEVGDDQVVGRPKPTPIVPIVDNQPVITCYICRGSDHYAISCQKYR